MKKILLFSLFILLCIPISVKAEVDIKSVSINGPAAGEEGTSIVMTVTANITGLTINQDSPFGIASVVFAFDFDDSVFILESFSTNGFASTVGKQDGIYYMTSVAFQDNNCAQNLLYCGDYKAELKFYIKNTSVDSSVVTLGELGVGFIDIENYETEEDVIARYSTEHKPHAILINHKQEQVVAPPKVNVPEKVEKPSVTVTPNISKTPLPKSSNALLKSLSVENYDLKFDTYLLEYTLEIEDNINNLIILAEPEDSKATYQVVGADDLKAHENKVEVEVTAEDGKKKTYVIHVKTKKNRRN